MSEKTREEFWKSKTNLPKRVSWVLPKLVKNVLLFSKLLSLNLSSPFFMTETIVSGELFIRRSFESDLTFCTDFLCFLKREENCEVQSQFLPSGFIIFFFVFINHCLKIYQNISSFFFCIFEIRDNPKNFNYDSCAVCIDGATFDENAKKPFFVVVKFPETSRRSFLVILT